MTDALSATTLNGALPDPVSAPDSPAVDSVATPINNSLVSDIKIDVDFTEQESDARHEPPALPKAEQLEDASVVPQVSTPVDPDSIPIAPPHGTPPPPPGELLEDVKMAEENASAKGADVEMSDASGQTNGLPNGQTPYANSVNANNDDNDDDKPPPAKRARKYSDAERASLANTATPPPASVSPPATITPLPSTSPPTLTPAQWRFCLSTVRTLKRMKDSGPFLNPVDPVALGIPHYPTIIKHPMDFSSIERKLTTSNPAKPDPNPANPRYGSVDDIVADIRLIFANCLTFNGPDHPVTQMGKRVEAVFDKQVKQMPPPEEPKPPAPKKIATPPPPPPPAPPKKAARRPSNPVPVIRRNDEAAGVSRPKREIHPPAPKDLPYAEATRKPRKAKAPRDAATAEQLKFCEKLWKDLHQKQHYTIAHPFYEPVDPVKMGIPEYPKVVKKPMDLATMKKKLDAGEYSTAEKFREDFRLMVKNCMTFNPPGNPVHEAGKALQVLFEEKWKNLPSPRPYEDSDDEEEEEEGSEDERARMIADMETQIENMKNHLASLKRPAKEKKEKKKEKPPKPTPPVASTSKPTPKQTKAPPAPKGKKTKKPVTDDDVLTFEQKKDLSDTISKLDGAKLERVIQIIHEGVPEIRDSTEEIELEIDQLPAAVLTKLYNFVIRPLKPPVKRPRTGKGTGTGGLKRKSMDEDVETKKIRALEEKLKSFEQGGRASGGGANGAGPAEESEHSSAESSSDESSASDSE
ncbi:Bromodomain-containing protein [Trametes versicolor FP-101664 SS1]|uniref:Bromodomain-containing protein n=1 Tax=Trametes versicolor (strain FP-101664) TaxID=717944 RepID=UPI00046249C6|nr:Bromodomain-containing protein [Trametes versicolor FP-101664 SS1]EIW64876.1 Bromodomain-containing protein [Trametes versicolor FP-101664 SS1]